MLKNKMSRCGIAAVSALTLIPLTYHLTHRPTGEIPSPSRPTAGSHPQNNSHSNCQTCNAQAPRDARQTSSDEIIGLIWETSSAQPASSATSLTITNGTPLADDFHIGERPSLVLENGHEIELEVKNRFIHGDGTVAVDAIVQGQPQGKLHLQWNHADDFFLGQIEYPHYPVAYEISKTDKGTPTITRHTIDQLICSEVHSSNKQVTYGLPAVNALQAAEAGEASGATDESSTTEEGASLIPALNSYPSATAVVYLDFDGQTVNGTSWGSSINATATGYTAAKITDIWQRVATDMEPFNLNVTTEESVFLAAPSAKRIRCIITPSNEWYGSNSAGGVAYLNSFRWSGDTPCWVFSDNLANGTKYIAEACSHEVGHTFGLSHDGKSSTTYYAGHGSGAVGWAPIMGNGYFKALTQWSKGEYSNATNTQDDLSIITSSSNGFGYRDDDHLDKHKGSTRMPRNGNNQVSGAGVIERRGDVDVFEVETGSGSISLDITPAMSISNLDIKVELHDAQGNILASSNPTTQTHASVSTIVDSGTYYLHVESTGYGNADTGSSNYASLGAYNITGQMAAVSIPTPYELTVDSLPENEREPNADPDGDGLSNLAEHVLGTNPSAPNATENFTSIDPTGATGADFLLDLPSEIPSDALYTVEATCDLSSETWDSIASRDSAGTWTKSSTVTVTEESGPNGKRRFRITDASGQSWTCRFMRVRFEIATY